MIPNVEYICPSHKHCPPKHKGLIASEKCILELLSSPKKRLEAGIHEAGHFTTAKKLGLAPVYEGPAVEHFKESDEWAAVHGRTCVSFADYQKLTAEQTAEYLVAGKVAEMVLLGSSPDNTSQSDFEALINSGKDGKEPPELIYLWKRAEEQSTGALREDLHAQQQIIHEAERCSQQMFGFDKSVKSDPQHKEKRLYIQGIIPCPNRPHTDTSNIFHARKRIK